MKGREIYLKGGPMDGKNLFVTKDTYKVSMFPGKNIKVSLFSGKNIIDEEVSVIEYERTSYFWNGMEIYVPAGSKINIKKASVPLPCSLPEDNVEIRAMNGLRYFLDKEGYKIKECLILSAEHRHNPHRYEYDILLPLGGDNNG